MCCCVVVLLCCCVVVLLCCCVAVLLCCCVVVLLCCCVVCCDVVLLCCCVVVDLFAKMKGMYADGGHYVCWVRAGEGRDNWILFDDDKVSAATLEDIKKLDGSGGGIV